MSINKNLTINHFLKNQNSLQTLRFITCGSVDDGKSTLIGRMLFESQLIFDDQIVSLEHDSKKSGTQGKDIDFALLVDGLAAEREQGITIDVAYRYFATDKRKFIVADTPGHEQYTRNMITGASTADAAIILVDARNGLMTQTKRHSYLCSLMGIKNIILAILKNAAEAASNSGGNASISINNPGEFSKIEDHCVDILIQNTGSEIPADKINKIWEPFYSSKESAHFGLGLTTAAVLAVQMNMRLGVISQNDSTVFWISIPTA